MKVWSGQAVFPVIGMVRAGVAEYLRACHHSLTEFLRERRQRLVIDAKSAEPIPRERDRDPSAVGRFCEGD